MFLHIDNIKGNIIFPANISEATALMEAFALVKTTTLVVQGGDTGQNRYNALFFCLLAKVIKHHRTNAPTGRFGLDKVGYLRSSSKHGEGIVGVEESEANHCPLLIFRRDTGKTFAFVDD